MSDIVIVAAARTPIGAFLGSLGSVPADQLGATVIKAALERAKLEAGEVSDVILGQVLTAGQGQNQARQAVIKAGLPIETPAITINQVCGSASTAAIPAWHAAASATSHLNTAIPVAALNEAAAASLPA